MSGFSNRPKILRGAFVEYGLSLPPLFVVFQFNPEQLTRNRSLTFSAPGNQTIDSPEGPQSGGATASPQRIQKSLRDLHQREFEDEDDLLAIQNRQRVDVAEETISFDIRMDATDDLNNGDVIAGLSGILPRLAALEQMAQPKGESLLGAAFDALAGLSSKGFSFTKKPNPPIILFIWGFQRVLPVNITSMSVVETEYSTILHPTRATVSIALQVIEGKNIPYLYSKGWKEVMTVLNLKNITEIANVVVPG
jgi:hypothetical protein